MTISSKSAIKGRFFNAHLKGFKSRPELSRPMIGDLLKTEGDLYIEANGISSLPWGNIEEIIIQGRTNGDPAIPPVPVILVWIGRINIFFGYVEIIPINDQYRISPYRTIYSVSKKSLSFAKIKEVINYYTGKKLFTEDFCRIEYLWKNQQKVR